MSTTAPKDNEAQRLEALAPYRSLGLEPDECFDRLTALAARLFQMPVALVTLVDDDTQFFKSHWGTNLCGTERKDAICNEALLLPPGEVLVVPDLAADPRFAQNEIVHDGPKLRFYAGAPMRTATGHVLGTLCLIDFVPRADLTSEQRGTLCDLAAVAMETFEQRLTQRKAREDLAERQWIESAMRSSEQRFRRIAANCPGMIYQLMLDADGKFRCPFVSEACKDLFGLEPQEIYEQPERLFAIIQPKARRSFLATIQRSRRTLTRWTWEGQYRARSGEERWIASVSQPEPLSDGRTQWHGMLIDITERKRLQDEAERAAERVRTVLESITDAFYSMDREWRFTYINDQAERMLGRQRETLLGRVFWEEFPLPDDSAFQRCYRHAMASDEKVSFEEYSPAANAWLSVNAYPSEDGLAIYFQDITARRNAQVALENSHTLLRTVIDGTDDLVFLKDRESRYVLINPAAAAIMGKPPEQIIGRSDAEFFSAEGAQNIRERDLNILNSGLSSTHEDVDVIAGVERVFLTTKSPYRDASGELVGVIGIARDTTERRRAAEALREAKEEAEKANHAKSDFLSRMSHELRTPLNAILGFGQLLEIGEITPQQTESVDHILRAGRHLLSLIDEVLSISRIEAGRMQLSLEPVSLSEVVRECLSLVERLATDRGVKLGYAGLIDAHGAGIFVRADRQRLRQVLLNLLSNAIKYNRVDGRVEIDCHLLPAPADAPATIRVAVTDTGAGLSEDEIARLWVPFERLKAERSNIEGTGLGLALSKGLVEAMGGKIGIESVPGEGSTFWLELPEAQSPLSDADPALLRAHGETLTEGHRGTVLYIEDNLSNLRLIECLLDREAGITLLSAEQGTLGIDVARARTPDLILLDLHLPDLPGWEVLAELQGDATTREIPVVVISADATAHQIARLRAAGAGDYLTKPIDVRELLRVLSNYLPTRTTDVAAGI